MYLFKKMSFFLERKIKSQKQKLLDSKNKDVKKRNIKFSIFFFFL